MQFGLADNRFEKIRAVLSRFATIDEVIIFGSRAMGNYRPSSDIDLALKGQNIPHTDVLKLRRALEELPYGYEYDVLDYCLISNPELIQHIDDFGITFYRKQ